MKILLINERIDFAGGAERYTVDIASGLTALGYNVKVIYGLPTPKNFQFSIFNFKSTMVENLNVEGVKKEVEAFNPDVINVQNIDDPEMLSELNHLKPTVRFIHDHRSYCPGNSKMWFSSNLVCPVPTSPLCGFYAFKEKCMTRRPGKLVARITQRRKMLNALKQLPVVLCNSRYVRDRLVQNGLDENKVVVNSLFPGGSPIENSGTLEYRSEVPEILFVGRVFLEKGVEYLLRAAALINEITFKITIIGEGWDLERCRKLAAELKIESRTKFIGFLPKEKVDDYYRSCRFLILPSIWPEPFGMVGLEAYNFGKPVIAYDTGGVSDWLIDNKTGYLVERGNIEILAQKMKHLLTDMDTAKRLGQAGRSLLLTTFTRERHLQQLTDIYRSLTAKVG